MNKAPYIFIVMIILLLCSCTRDRAITPPPILALCDTISPSYTTCIKPILIRECYACHSDSASQGGVIAFDIQNFSSFKSYLTYRYRGDSIYGSKLMAEITYLPLVIHMPPIGQIPDSEAVLIQKWIEKGGQNN